MGLDLIELKTKCNSCKFVRKTSDVFMNYKVFFPVLVSGFLFSFCSDGAKEEQVMSVGEKELNTVRVDDKHSYANIDEVYTKHLDLNIEVNFDTRTISGVATHLIENKQGTDTMVLDAKNLVIDKVTVGEQEQPTFFRLGTMDSLLGQSLYVALSGETIVHIHYSTTENTQAVDWLSPNLTAGKKYPFLYTQGQAILTRTWIPIQDTPANRITYSARVKVPSELMAVMSATNPQEKTKDGIYHFRMDQSIPSYLIALAVGDLRFKALDERSGVYAEPSVIDAAVYEFADMPEMINTAEDLYGKYKWERYDVIVLPPAFPFGGMENPRLTFATPTILAGDRSLVSLIAHELAHSWSGNLVTNATWEDFWLNEGFTVYFESRIMEAVAGREIAEMLTLIEYQELMHEVEDIGDGKHPEDTHLKLTLSGRDPDEGMTTIAYNKGALFLMTLEDKVGREKFDRFIRDYFASHAFETLTTEEFLVYLEKNLLEPESISFNTDEWIYGPGIPDNCRKITSDRFEKVDSIAALFIGGKPAEQLGLNRKSWVTQEWMNFIRKLPDSTETDRMKELDQVFGFKNWGNSEIMSEWYIKSIRTGYSDVRPEMEAFLVQVGRRKFLEPIYEALTEKEDDKEWAKQVYKKARGNYHSITAGTIDRILFGSK